MTAEAGGAHVPVVSNPDHDFRQGRGRGGDLYTADIMRRNESSSPLGEPATDADRADTIARWVGLATAVAAAIPVLLLFARRPELVAQPRYAAWSALFVIFFIALWAHKGTQATKGFWALLFVQSAAATGMTWMIPVHLQGVLMVIIAGTLGLSAGLGVSLAWITVQTLAFALPLARAEGWEDATVTFLAFLGFQLFALYTGRTAEKERRGRAELARVNAELLATRKLLEESSRAAERLRISRDLHDVLGHHLTALSLNLETARHAPPAAAAERVETAHGIARRLLGEVREVVGRLREEGEIDLEGALAVLAEGIHRPRIHLTVAPEASRVEDPRRAEALVRTVQEVITNAVRHAGAENLWVSLVAGEEEGIELVARDDGRGLPGRGRMNRGRVGKGRRTSPDGELPPGGHGLAGMRERLERLGGRLRVGSPPEEGSGVEVRAWLPAEPVEGGAP